MDEIKKSVGTDHNLFEKEPEKREEEPEKAISKSTANSKMEIQEFGINFGVTDICHCKKCRKIRVFSNPHSKYAGHHEHRFFYMAGGTKNF